MGLVVQVGADHGRLRPVAVGQHPPIIDPAVLGDAVRIPELALRIGARPVAVEHDRQLPPTRPLDDAVHQLQAGEPLEIRISGEVDGGGKVPRLDQLIAERQPDGIEAGRHDLVEHLLPVSGPESVRGEDRSLQTEPVHPGQSDLLPVAVDQLPAQGSKSSARRRAGSAGGLMAAGRRAAGIDAWQQGGANHPEAGPAGTVQEGAPANRGHSASSLSRS